MGGFLAGTAMTPEEEVKNILGGLSDLSPAGYAIGLHLEFTTSKYIFQNYPKAWMDEYTRRGFILSDPTVRWGVENLGWTRWSDLAEIDQAGVITAAAEFGLRYGVSISVEGLGGRSLGSFAATDKDFDEAAIAGLSSRLDRMHELTAGIEAESEADRSLKKLAASMAHG